MSIQNIINSAVYINVNRTKVASSAISRNGRHKTGQLIGNQPFLFTVGFAPKNTYSSTRGVLEDIDRLDIITKESVEIGSSNTGLSWITAYQGDLSASDLGNITATTTYSGQTIDLDVSGCTGAISTDYVFKKNDYFILDGGYKYPYTVTADVQRGGGSTITVNVNRPIIEQSGYTINTGKGVLVGNDVTWQLKMLTKPTYQIQPDRYVEFNGEFNFIEVIED